MLCVALFAVLAVALIHLTLTGFEGEGCGCFGAARCSQVGWAGIERVIVLGALAAISATATPPSDTTHPGTAVVSAVAGVVVAGVLGSSSGAARHGWRWARE